MSAPPTGSTQQVTGASTAANPPTPANPLVYKRLQHIVGKILIQ